MQTPPKPVHIRGLAIDPPLFLAPMAGLTHTALRQTILSFGGIGLLSTEMLSAKRLPTESPAVSPYLIRTSAERPLSCQLLTSTPDEIPRAIEVLQRIKADAIDLNMGCPAAAVGRFGAGFSLMEQPETVRRIVSEARKHTTLPLTAKIRLGTRPDDHRLKDFCILLQDEGIDLLSVHARLKHESFARRPRWEALAGIKEWLTIPVIANGGIFSVHDAKDCLAVSGADGLMLGRGAAIKPWLFAEISREVFGRSIAEPRVSLPALYATFLDRLELFRPQYRIGRLKEFTHYFARNYQFGHYLASRVQSSMSVDEARERARLFFEENST
ncbi:MAG TPA: tRNA-dihydrouridine synthase family protein [Nitrospirota bacterium]|nr:tRNA-dihydrouridine synthase family protein [Nitrospirota bacterium]